MRAVPKKNLLGMCDGSWYFFLFVAVLNYISLLFGGGSLGYVILWVCAFFSVISFHFLNVLSEVGFLNVQDFVGYDTKEKCISIDG